MTHVTCRLTAKNRDQLRNPTLGNRVWATFTFTLLCVQNQILFNSWRDVFDGRGGPFNYDKVPVYSFTGVDVMRDTTWSVGVYLRISQSQHVPYSRIRLTALFRDYPGEPVPER